jgi:hypothetical protein
VARLSEASCYGVAAAASLNRAISGGPIRGGGDGHDRQFSTYPYLRS